MSLMDPARLARGEAGVQLSYADARATIHPDGFSENGYVLEIGEAEQSHVDLGDPAYVFYEYLRRIANVIDLVRPAGEPIVAAHLGAGALTLARYIQATRPGSAQVAVDIEPQMLSFVTDILPLPAGTRCELVTADAREVLPELAGYVNGAAFDALILDIFTGVDAPAHLANRGYYAELKALLAPGGVLAVNVGDDEGLPFFQQQAPALLEVFEHVWCLAESSMFTGNNEGNLVLIATDRELDEESADALYARGPHPAEVLDTEQLREFLAALADA